MCSISMIAGDCSSYVLCVRVYTFVSVFVCPYLYAHVCMWIRVYVYYNIIMCNVLLYICAMFYIRSWQL